jgi:hypothetical protein
MIVLARAAATCRCNPRPGSRSWGNEASGTVARVGAAVVGTAKLARLAFGLYPPSVLGDPHVNDGCGGEWADSGRVVPRGNDLYGECVVSRDHPRCAKGRYSARVDIQKRLGNRSGRGEDTAAGARERPVMPQERTRSRGRGARHGPCVFGGPDRCFRCIPGPRVCRLAAGGKGIRTSGLTLSEDAARRISESRWRAQLESRSSQCDVPHTCPTTHRNIIANAHDGRAGQTWSYLPTRVMRRCPHERNYSTSANFVGEIGKSVRSPGI